MIIKHTDERFWEFIKSARAGMQSLIGKEFFFYGVFQNQFKIDDLILEALEDPNDGYRSTLGLIQHTTKTNGYKHFHKKPIAYVEVEEISGDLKGFNDYVYSDFEGFALRDTRTNTYILAVGTSDVGDYYPAFVFNYNPDKNQTEYLTIPQDYKPFKERYPEIILKAIDWYSDSAEDYPGY